MLEGLNLSLSASGVQDLSGPWLDAVNAALSDFEVEVLCELHANGLPLPVQGFEAPDGSPLDLAWPDQQVALQLDAGAPTQQDSWTVLAPLETAAATVERLRKVLS